MFSNYWQLLSQRASGENKNYNENTDNHCDPDCDDIYRDDYVGLGLNCHDFNDNGAFYDDHDVYDNGGAGKLHTNAHWMRKFVREHPSYKHDSRYNLYVFIEERCKTP